MLRCLQCYLPLRYVTCFEDGSLDGAGAGLLSNDPIPPYPHSQDYVMFLRPNDKRRRIFLRPIISGYLLRHSQQKDLRKRGFVTRLRPRRSSRLFAVHRCRYIDIRRIFSTLFICLREGDRYLVITQSIILLYHHLSSWQLSSSHRAS